MTEEKRKRWMWAGGLSVAALFGALTGLGAFTMHYGHGFSYFSEDPAACVNCHIMRPQYDSWLKSSHSAFAGCAACHLPEEFPYNLISKAENGWSHSWAFTFQDFHEPIQIKPRNERVLENNCLRCHREMVHPLLTYHEPVHRSDKISCVHCHAAVGHGPTR